MCTEFIFFSYIIVYTSFKSGAASGSDNYRHRLLSQRDLLIRSWMQVPLSPELASLIHDKRILVPTAQGCCRIKQDGRS